MNNTKRKLLFTLGCSFTEGDGAYPDEPFFEPEGIPLDGSKRTEIHGTPLQQKYRNTYTDDFHKNGWPAQLVKKYKIRPGMDDPAELVKIYGFAASKALATRSLITFKCGRG